MKPYCSDCAHYRPGRHCPITGQPFLGSRQACAQFRPLKLPPLSDLEAQHVGRRLAAEMLLCALRDDAKRYRPRQSGEYRADRWVRRVNEQPPGFDWCCNVLTLEPDWLRGRWSRLVGLCREHGGPGRVRHVFVAAARRQGMSWAEVEDRWGMPSKGFLYGKVDDDLPDEEFVRKLDAALARLENPGSSNPNRFLMLRRAG